MPEQRWVFAIKAQNKPGALTATAGVFSNRGVSLETTLCSGLTLGGVDGGRIILSFRATPRKKDMLLRTVERLSAVLHVDCYPYSSLKIRAIAVIRVSSTSDVDWETPDVRAEIISESNENQTMLLTGSTLAIEQFVETLCDRNVLLDVAMSVMAV